MNKKRGRKKRKYLPYEEAKSLLHAEQLPHRVGYWRWIRMYEPKGFPYRPEVVYSEWKGWNDYLGNNNKFKGGARVFRTYEEAMLWARSQQIGGFKQWMKTDLPCDIPRRPDVYYRGKFVGWKNFLGTGKNAPANIIEGAKAVEKLDNILLIAIPRGEDIGVVHVSIHLGIGRCKDFINQYSMRYVKGFYLEDGYDYTSVLRSHGEDWGEGKWKIRNINAMLFDINLRWVQ